jgi:hypothetical protein
MAAMARGRTLGRNVGGHRPRIVVGLVFQQVVLRRIVTPRFLEGEKLVPPVT